MTKAQKPHRTLKEAIDLDDMRSITSDELLEMSDDDYNDIRRASTISRNAKEIRYCCAKCGYGVVAPINGATRRPYWSHLAGAPGNCPWWTGKPRSVNAVSASQFRGAQESPLHLRIKTEVAGILQTDPLTAVGSVNVETYVTADNGRRKPDIRAIHNGHPTAFEIQLSTTQIPIIVARETFYQNEGFRLVWITWQFEPVPLSLMRIAFKDIFYSHNKNIFSVDPESIALSKADKQLTLRVFWNENGEWKNELRSLQELNWTSTGLAYAVAPAPPWHEKFRERWKQAEGRDAAAWSARNSLLHELIATLGMADRTPRDLLEENLDAVLFCILSLFEGRPLASRQSNLVSLVNTFLSAKDRFRFARLIRTVIRVSGNDDLLARESVRKKLKIALDVPQIDRDGELGRIVLKVFPEIGAGS